jgi:hypothetical protein
MTANCHCHTESLILKATPLVSVMPMLQCRDYLSVADHPPKTDIGMADISLERHHLPREASRCQTPNPPCKTNGWIVHCALDVVEFPLHHAEAER